MTVAMRRGLDATAGSEAFTLAHERGYRFNARRRPVIFFPGGVGGDRKFLESPADGSVVTGPLVEVGYPFISAAFGGASQWGNDLAQARIANAWTKVKADLGTRTDKFIGIGASQGFNALCLRAIDNPAEMIALIGLVPAIPAANIYDEDRAGNRANIDAAYASYGGWPANEADHDPLSRAAAFGALGIPTLLVYSTSDPIILSSEVLAFASAAGSHVETHSLGAVGHSAATLDPDVVLDFLEAYL